LGQRNGRPTGQAVSGKRENSGRFLCFKKKKKKKKKKEKKKPRGLFLGLDLFKEI